VIPVLATMKFVLTSGWIMPLTTSESYAVSSKFAIGAPSADHPGTEKVRSEGWVMTKSEDSASGVEE
jgi:hypothetical protein